MSNIRSQRWAASGTIPSVFPPATTMLSSRRRLLFLQRRPGTTRFLFYQRPLVPSIPSRGVPVIHQPAHGLLIYLERWQFNGLPLLPCWSQVHGSRTASSSCHPRRSCSSERFLVLHGPGALLYAATGGAPLQLLQSVPSSLASLWTSFPPVFPPFCGGTRSSTDVCLPPVFAH